MEKLIHETTKEHFEKYRDLAKRLGNDWSNLSSILGLNKEQMIEKYLEDKYLNSIPLKQWDNLALCQNCAGSLAEKVCLVKHLTIYHFIGAEFKEESK